jgi:XTP/dITP diphosphohydrolase
MKLLIATTNAGKCAELKDLLQESGYEVVTPKDIGLSLDVDESGQTYDENALLKALAFCQASGLISLADDTGLEVDALGGRPGVYSARYAGSDAERRTKLLGELKNHPRPWKAHFHCSVAVAAPEADPRLFEGDVYGEITQTESGEFGFGYDRIFFIPEAGKTLADLALEEKNRFSHRAVAVKKALEYLRELK